MHFQKSSFLLLTTAALASVAVASRPSSATPVAALDTDANIAQRDVNHKSAKEPLVSIAIKNDIWADPKYFKQDAPVATMAHHDAADIDAKSKNDIAKRAAVSATTTNYKTKTLTTDVAHPTVQLKETSGDSSPEVKAKGNANYQSKQVAQPLSGNYVTVANELSSRRTGVADMTKTPSVHNNSVKTRSGIPASVPTGLFVGQSSSRAVVKSRIPPSDKLTASPAPARSKRDPGTFEYIYDSTTVLVTPTPPAQHSLLTGTGTRKLRFGGLASVPIAHKSHS